MQVDNDDDDIKERREKKTVTALRPRKSWFILFGLVWGKLLCSCHYRHLLIFHSKEEEKNPNQVNEEKKKNWIEKT